MHACGQRNCSCVGLRLARCQWSSTNLWTEGKRLTSRPFLKCRCSYLAGAQIACFKVKELCGRCITWEWTPWLCILMGFCLLQWSPFVAKMKLPRRGVKTVFTCGWKDKCLECSQGLSWFSKVVVVGSPPRSMISPALGSWLGSLLLSGSYV